MNITEARQNEQHVALIRRNRALAKTLVSDHSYCGVVRQFTPKYYTVNHDHDDPADHGDSTDNLAS